MRIYCLDEDKHDPDSLVDVCMTRREAEIIYEIMCSCVFWSASSDTVENFARELTRQLTVLFDPPEYAHVNMEHRVVFFNKEETLHLYLTPSNHDVARAQSDTE